MKPHEDELSVVPFSDAVESPQCLVSASDQRLVACFRGGATKDWEMLLSAAPDMARALLRNLRPCANTGSATTGCKERDYAPCLHCLMREALIKAGVL